jgi:hypothetical protein
MVMKNRKLLGKPSLGYASAAPDRQEGLRLETFSTHEKIEKKELCGRRRQQLRIKSL